jgi:integrase/recombinase XerD
LIPINIESILWQEKFIALGEFSMKQAKTLTEKELKQVLTYISLHRHAARNRAMLLLTHWAGMRVGEVAALRIGDILNADGSIKSEIRLLAEQTKGRHARTVFVGQRLRKELMAYAATLKCRSTDQPLFATQKKQGFTANTLCQAFHWLYKEVGIDGASSHSGRRSFITNLASKGVGVRVLMALAGHRDISTTQRYIDVNDEMQRAAVDLV